MTSAFAIAHPMHLDGVGRVAGATHAEHLEQMMWLTLLTAPGERVNRPDFGAGLARFVFEGGNSASAALRLELRAYLSRQFAGQLTIDEFQVERDDDTLQIAVAYRATDSDARRVVHWRIDDADLSSGLASLAEPAIIDPPLAALDHRPLPWVDYLARDYDSFRTAMLERLAALTPRWTERNPADVGVALIEALAHAADCLSYKQDAIGAEAHLATAQLRTSIARHARLRDERLLEGTNARVWVRVSIAGERRFRLPVGTRLLTRIGEVGAAVSSKWPSLGACIDPQPDVFMTLHEVELAADRDTMALVAAPGVAAGTLGKLAAGATSATLEGHPQGLAEGDVLILEVPGRPLADGMLARQPIRLAAMPVPAHDRLGRPITHISWHDDDRLGIDLPIGVDADGAPLDGAAVARGNIVLADQGDAGVVALPPVDGGELYRPSVDQDNLVWSVPFDPGVARRQSAASAVAQDPRRSVAALLLEEHDSDGEVVRRWYSRPDLLAGHRFASDFVAERHDNGATLRFGGGGVAGTAPRIGTRLAARYRRTAHRPAAIGPGAIAHLVTDQAALRAAIRSVGNPLASTAPELPQSIEEARRLIGAHAGRGAMTDPAATMAALLRGRPEVADVVVERRLADGREQLVCRVLPVSPSPLLDGGEANRLAAAVRVHMPVGITVEVRGPDLVPLAIELDIGLGSRAGEASVSAMIRRVLGDGEEGLFGSPRRALGMPTRLVDVRDAIGAIAGVAAVEISVLRALTGDAGEVARSGQVSCPATAVIVGPVSSRSPAQGTLALRFRRERPA